MDALYDRLTPYVLGMEQAPGLKNMKKRLTGEHKDAVKTRADEAAKLFEKIEDLISCSLDEAELDRKAAEPRLRALFAAVRTLTPALRPGSGTAAAGIQRLRASGPAAPAGRRRPAHRAVSGHPAGLRRRHGGMSIRTRTLCRTPFTAVWPARQGMTSSSWAT